MPLIISVPESFTTEMEATCRNLIIAHLREKPAGLAFVEIIPEHRKRKVDGHKSEQVWAVRFCRLGGAPLPGFRLLLIQIGVKFLLQNEPTKTTA